MNVNPNKAKCCFCEKRGATIPGFCKKLKPRLACGPCAFQYEFLKANFGKGFSHSVTPAIDVNKLTESAQQAMEFNTGTTELRRWGLFRANGVSINGTGPGLNARRRLKENLSLCACTHKATRHADDGQGNLLHCRDCDCTHFWYAVPQTRSTDLVVLGEASLSAEASLLDKLAAMANDARTNANERIAASRRISAILQKKAA